MAALQQMLRDEVFVVKLLAASRTCFPCGFIMHLLDMESHGILVSELFIADLALGVLKLGVMDLPEMLHVALPCAEEKAALFALQRIPEFLLLILSPLVLLQVIFQVNFFGEN